MKREVLVALIEKRLEELRIENVESYSLYQFCVEVIPNDERQSKHIDILEYLLDNGVQIRCRGIKFQPVRRQK